MKIMIALIGGRQREEKLTFYQFEIIFKQSSMSSVHLMWNCVNGEVKWKETEN